MTFQQRYMGAFSFEEYVEGAQKNQEFWRAIHRRARVPKELVARVGKLPGRWHLLILVEDWCGDGVSTVPVVARLAELAPNVDCRILARDQNPDIMDAHLTNGSRSIPLVIVLDQEYKERGWWGPRPRELQEWVLTHGLQLPKDERSRELRRWYARDQGRSTLKEAVELLEQCAEVVP